MKSLLGLLLVSCGASITPAQHVDNLKAEIDMVKLGCRVYEFTESMPRDSHLSEDCTNLLNRQPVGATSTPPPGATR